MKCGLYSLKDSSGRQLYYKLTEEFAQARPWYTLVRDCDCGDNVRMADGETIAASRPPHERQPMRGAGDVVAATIHFATLGLVTPCKGCEERQDWLNRAIPFGKPKARQA
jgi:hypothetical protein